MHGFIWGGMRGFIQGGVHGFFSFFGYSEIQSMSGRYASYWNAFLFFLHFSLNWEVVLQSCCCFYFLVWRTLVLFVVPLIPLLLLTEVVVLNKWL